MRQTSLLLADLFLIALATIGALVLRGNFEVTEAQVAALVPYLGLTLLVSASIFAALGTNRAVWRLTTMADYLTILGATVASVIGAVALGFGFNRLEGIARALPVLQGLLMLCALVGLRVLARVRHAARARPAQLVQPSTAGRPGQTVLLVGLNRLAELYLRSAVEFGQNRIVVAGVLGQRARHAGRVVSQHRILGAPEQVEQALQTLEVHGVIVDRIAVMVPFECLSSPARQALLKVERTTSIRIDFVGELLGFDARPQNDPAGNVSPGTAEETPVFAIEPCDLEALARRPYWRIKRVLDVVACLVLLFVLAPIVVAVAILVAADVGRPVTFWQQRPGTGGRPFKLYKFRTMAAAHDGDGRRIDDASRISATGRFLRRTRLDELPQLFNILVGDMSFVGPRPLLPVDQPVAYAARLLVRPGLTGWGQVKGGRAISAADKAALDVWYVMSASLRLDVIILLKTVAMVLFGEKASTAAIHRAWRELRQSGICARPGAAEVPRGLLVSKQH